jgi:hypothetical protein
MPRVLPHENIVRLSASPGQNKPVKINLAAGGTVVRLQILYADKLTCHIIGLKNSYD